MSSCLLSTDMCWRLLPAGTHFVITGRLSTTFYVDALVIGFGARAVCETEPPTGPKACGCSLRNWDAKPSDANKPGDEYCGSKSNVLV